MPPPQCSDYGEGWSGEYPNCVYNAPDFGGDVSDLGYQELLPLQIEGTPWSEFFDPYDPTRQEMAETGAGIDIGQLQSAWDMQQQQLSESYELGTEQLGKTWGLKKGELGWGAGLGLGKARRTGISAKRKSGLAFSGTAEEIQRTAESDVMTKYRGGVKVGETAYQQALGTAGLGYEQALETGQFGLTQATTDIGQRLQEDIYGFQEDWRREQRGTLNVLLGMGIQLPGGEDDVCWSQGNPVVQCCGPEIGQATWCEDWE